MGMAAGYAPYDEWMCFGRWQGEGGDKLGKNRAQKVSEVPLCVVLTSLVMGIDLQISFHILPQFAKFASLLLLIL
jgi:hypothetical protein